MLASLRPALIVFAALTFLTGVIYPLAVTGVAQLAFRDAANGSILVVDGNPVGSSLIGQPFSSPRYFWGRPSATSPQPYNGGASGGSNFGPAHPALAEAMKARVEALRAADPSNRAPIPSDLVTASASGLDPHVTLAGAQWQIGRVARARGLSPERVRALVEEHAELPFLGVLGEPRVNVLRLNLALDKMG
jgi:K+-transporting ATPase ATPase C chain